MPLVGGRELLAGAERGSYAVPGFNVSNAEMALGVIDAAEARHAPVLLQFNSANLDHLGGIAPAVALARALAEGASVPVAVHMDHVPDTPRLREGAAAGFTSLMFDGSTRPLERNLRETHEAYAIAARAGLALEAELGHVGGREAGVVTSELRLTDPAAASRFVQETRIDALAVSVGTAHGMTGHIDLHLVRELRQAVRGLPLVLHGGSGVRGRDLREAIAAGVRKVNIGTELHAAFARAIAETAGDDPRPALRAARAAVATVAESRIELLGAAGQA